MNSDDGLPPQQPNRPRRFQPKLSAARRVFKTPTSSDVSSRDAGLAVHQERSQIRDNATPGGSGNPDGCVSSNFDPVVTKETKKDYGGPWGNVRNPPITLPLRRPSSEDPEILNKLEFGENQTKEPNESCATHSTELGLNENNESPKFMRIQFPPNFPFPQHQPDTSESSVPTTKPEPSTKGKESATIPPVSVKGSVPPPRREAMEPSLPPPHAKLRTYKSGKVNFKMGELLFDVIPGIYSETVARDLVAINTEENFCELGIIEKMMVVTPDVDMILEWGNNK